MNIEQVARVTHEVNRAYCASLGDHSQPAWEDAPEWQRKSAIAGVTAVLGGSARTPAESHEGWLRQKRADGWTYGPVKDAEKKTHPCFVPYDQLPPEQKAKDYIFRAVVTSLGAHVFDPESDPGHGDAYNGGFQVSKTPIMRYFEYAHLPERLQLVSKPIGDLAAEMDRALPDGAEKSAGLRKLLEAKDCLVRAALDLPTT